jgi:agmatinase
VTVIDPLGRWRRYGEKPDYAGLLSFGGAPYTEEPTALHGADAVILGAPTDDLVSDRPGARFAPRAIRAASCPPGPHLEAGIDAFAEMRVMDYGDAPVIPADPQTSHEAIREHVGHILDAGAVPILLGGDHGITEPSVTACAAAHGPVGLIHFDAHTDTGEVVFGVSVSHGTPMRRLVEAGAVDPLHYAQLGLRGYWPGEEEFAWQTQRGILSIFMHAIRAEGIAAAVAGALAQAGTGPTYLTVDIDVLDPGAIGGGTGTPEPGGMAVADLLWACREVAARTKLVGADVVEVIPVTVGSTDIAALTADRLVREILTGIALRRRSGV